MPGVWMRISSVSAMLGKGVISCCGAVCATWLNGYRIRRERSLVKSVCSSVGKLSNATLSRGRSWTMDLALAVQIQQLDKYFRPMHNCTLSTQLNSAFLAPLKPPILTSRKEISYSPYRLKSFGLWPVTKWSSITKKIMHWITTGTANVHKRTQAVVP